MGQWTLQVGLYLPNGIQNSLNGLSKEHEWDRRQTDDGPRQGTIW